MSTEPTPQQAAASKPSPASPATTPPPMQGVDQPNAPTPASVPSSTTAPVSQPGTPTTPPQLQAAQLSHTVATIGLLAEGAKPPSPPKISPKIRRKKSNKLDFRADDELLNRIYQRMALTCQSESETLRSLVMAGLGAPAIILQPRTPPEQLEAFMGAMSRWHRDFQAVKSRLNAPMPRDPEDEELVALVKQWRMRSQQLLDQIPRSLEAARIVSTALTSLTPERVSMIRDQLQSLKRWAASREKKATTESNPLLKVDHEQTAKAYRALITLIEELGFSQKSDAIL